VNENTLLSAVKNLVVDWRKTAENPDASSKVMIFTALHVCSDELEDLVKIHEAGETTTSMKTIKQDEKDKNNAIVSVANDLIGKIRGE